MASTLRIGGAALLLAFVPSTPASLVQSPSQGSHVIVARDDIQWKPLRPGAEIAVVSGDPAKEGSLFVIRMRYRGKARIPPHWHPVDEHLTVLSGTFRIGMGERGDEAATTALVAGSYALLPAKMPHYAWTGGDALIQVHGVGPFAINTSTRQMILRRRTDASVFRHTVRAIFSARLVEASSLDRCGFELSHHTV